MSAPILAFATVANCLLVITVVSPFLGASRAAFAEGSADTAGTGPSIPEGLVFDVDVPYGTASERQRLDILYPADPDVPRPAIVLFHSGGWCMGDKGGASTLEMMCDFADAGYVVLSAGYRLSDEAVFPAAVQDCKHAVRWLRANADQYGVDPKRIGAMGASAGGHLAAMLAVTRRQDGLDGVGEPRDESCAVQATVPVCAPLDLRVPLCEKLAHEDDPLVVRFLGGPIADKADAARRASPITYVRKDLPPMLLIHGAEDARVNPSQSERMADALGQAGAPVELLLVEGAGHGMIAREAEVLRRVVGFFEKHLKKTAAPKRFE